MGKYHYHKHSFDDLVSIGLVKFGFALKKLLAKLHITDRFYEGLSEHYRYPKSMDWKTIYMHDVKVETLSYKDVDPSFCLLQCHGGAYVYDFNDNYRKMAKQYIKIKPSLKVYSPYYALAPQNPFPKALNQMVNIYRELLKTYPPEKIVFTGDSAGGGLVLALAYELYDQGLPRPKAIITMSAWTDFLGRGASYLENDGKDVFFKNGDIDQEKRFYASTYPYDCDKISPKYGDYQKLPSLLMFVGGNELIKSDSIDIALKHESAIVHEFSKMFHVYPLGFNFMKSSRTSWRIIQDYLNQQLKEVKNDEKL